MRTTIYKNHVEIIAKGLHQVFSEYKNAEAVLAILLVSDKRLGSKDRHFIADIYYDMIRYWRHCEVLLQRQTGIGKSNYFMLVCLWLVYRKYDIKNWREVTAWNFKSIQEEISEPPAIVHSFPDWMWKHGETSFGAKWLPIAEALNVPASVYIRVNTLKTSKADLIMLLEEEEMEVEPVLFQPDAIEIFSKVKLSIKPSYQKGLYEIQDVGSQQIAPFLEVEPGQLVMDACAGAGGKSLHLAALMQNQGRILALDVQKSKLEKLEQRAKRNGVDIIRTYKYVPPILNRWVEKVDRLLLDVPCSGIGVIKRHAETKWRVTEKQFLSIVKLQGEIMRAYMKVLKPGGKMVYATCSIMPEENEKQIEAFQKEFPNFHLEAMHNVSPVQGYDGFFMARLIRE